MWELKATAGRVRDSCEDEFNLDQSNQGDHDPSAADKRSAWDTSKPSHPPPPWCNSRTHTGHAKNVLAIFYSGRVKSSTVCLQTPTVQHFQYSVSLSLHMGRLMPACPGPPPFPPPCSHTLSHPDTAGLLGTSELIWTGQLWHLEPTHVRIPPSIPRDRPPPRPKQVSPLLRSPSPRRTLCSLEPDVTSDKFGSVHQLWDFLIPPRLPYKQKGRGCASLISSPTALLPLNGNCDTWESASVMFP